MSNISRSAYQKLAEENKRLKADIKILVWVTSPEDVSIVWRKCYNHFKKEHDFHQMMKDILTAKQQEG